MRIEINILLYMTNLNGEENSKCQGQGNRLVYVNMLLYRNNTKEVFNTGKTEHFFRDHLGQENSGISEDGLFSLPILSC